MRFFFLDSTPPTLEGAWSPPQALHRHLKALRLGADEEFLLLLPMGGAVRAKLGADGALNLNGLTEMPRLPLFPVTLATSWPKGTRADQLVARATEAGVERIVPIVCKRSIAGKKPFGANRLGRWRRIAREACQQCGRPVPPTLDAQPIPLVDVLKETPVAQPIALEPNAWPLMMELGLHTPREVLLIVGPEGGFTGEELEWLEANNVHRAGLLPTILRIEAAGPVAASLCQHWFMQMPSR